MEEIKERIEKEVAFNEVLNDFDDQVKNAFLSLCNNYIDFGLADMKGIVSIKGSDIYICVENAIAYDNELCISFLIGTRILKPGKLTIEKVDDMRKVFFDGNGKRLQCSMEMNLMSEKHQTRDEQAYIEEFCSVVTKRVLGIKLTKAERKNPWYTATNMSGNASVIVLFSLMVLGIISALLFTIGMMIFTLIIGLSAVFIFRKPIILLEELMLDNIWLKLFGGTFCAVEAVVAIITIISCISSWISGKRIDKESY